MNARGTGGNRPDDGMADVPARFVETAMQLAAAAREITLAHFRTALPVEAKSDESPVTRADREAEAAMRAIIERQFPEHGILGEEYGSQDAEAEYVWVLDPIDGTRSFIIGDPEYGTLVALTRHGRPVLGLIDMPALGERCLGAAGRPTIFTDARRGAAEARARPCPGLAQATLRVTDPFNYGGDAAAFGRLSTAVGALRFSGDCFNYGQVASGFVDLVAESGLGAYDYSALVPVIEGAGGLITDWSGRPLDLASDGRVVAAGDRACHSEALKLLQE
ncbi:MAG: histidinol-phosphatase [Rhodovibrionaceae bacterium]|nr:histidinol-phosphatase [Rhodovibrionaceae bacterium]